MHFIFICSYIFCSGRCTVVDEMSSVVVGIQEERGARAFSVFKTGADSKAGASILWSTVAAASPTAFLCDACVCIGKPRLQTGSRQQGQDFNFVVGRSRCVSHRVFAWRARSASSWQHVCIHVVRIASVGRSQCCPPPGPHRARQRADSCTSQVSAGRRWDIETDVAFS